MAWPWPWPWAGSDHISSDQPGPSNALVKKLKYVSCLKRINPYVYLATDSCGRNLSIQSLAMFTLRFLIMCAHNLFCVIVP